MRVIIVYCRRLLPSNRSPLADDVLVQHGKMETLPCCTRCVDPDFKPG